MSRKRLLLVGWDAADWKIIQPLVDAGQMPTVQRLLETGVSGNLATLEPCLSPMLWTSIATGKHAYHHGVHGFTEVDPRSGRVVPVSAGTRRCKTLWEMLGEHGLTSNVVSWFATQGERDFPGRMVSNMFNSFRHRREDPPEAWPAPPAGTYWPESLAERMNALRVSPWDIDPDEILRLFVPEAHTVDQSRDGRLWYLLQRLAETFSVHAATCHLLEQEGDWDFTAVYYRAIDELSHEFMAFHPPRMPGVPEREFELYQGVMNAAYRLHDLLLARLLHLAGPDTAVVLVSDHGFHSDHLRPGYTPDVPAGIVVWHRPHGVFAAAGPGFAADSLVHGARLLDVAPTVLAWFGLPVGADMEGRVLREAFTVPPEPRYIASWESGEAPARRHQSRLGAADQQAVLEQFVALGYLDALPDDAGEAAAQTRRENLWNLARACVNGGRLEQALPLLEEVYFEHPERQDYTQQLALCQFRLGLAEEGEATVQGCLDAFGDTETAQLIRARVAVERGRSTEALAWLEQVRDRAPRDLQLLNLLGQTLLRLRRWEACAEVCRTALEVDPDNVPARLGLARCALATKAPAAAQSWALEAIGREYGNARAHFLLGVALHRQALWADAVTALRMALALSPGHGPARSYLSATLRELGESTEAATLMLEHTRVALDARRRASARLARLRAESAARREAWENARRERRAAAARAREAAAAALLAPDQEFLIVSGLPRSGTSLMMNMLEAAGLPIMTDGERRADEDNPEGYREWEAVKRLPREPLIIEQAQGKAVKVVSALLPHLPPKHRYKVIFMRRPVGEVAVSQATMRERRGTPAPVQPELTEALRTHAEQTLQGLRQNARICLLEVDYPELVADPLAGAARVAAFLGEAYAGRIPAMAARVKPALHRQRAESPA